MHLRQERHVRDFDNLPLFDAFLVLSTEYLLAHTRSPERIERMNLGFDFALERGDPIILIVLKVTVGKISVVFRRFSVIDYILAEVL